MTSGQAGDQLTSKTTQISSHRGQSGSSFLFTTHSLPPETSAFLPNSGKEIGWKRRDFCMATRKRMVHEKLFDSDQVHSLSIPERLLYVAMIVTADDYGFFRADAKHLKRKVFYEDKIGSDRIVEMTKHIHEIGLIELHEYENKVIGHHPKWNLYQTLRADRAKHSDFSDFLGDTKQPTDNQPSPEVKIREVKEEKKSEAMGARKLPRELMLEGMKEREDLIRSMDMNRAITESNSQVSTNE